MKFYRINALMLKYYYITINRLDRLFDIVYWPVLDLILWGFASAFIEDISKVNVLSMILGGIILWVFVWRSSQDMAVFVLEDFWSRNLYHLFSSPVRISEHMVSIFLIGFIRAFATFFFLAILAFLINSFNILTIPLFYIAIAMFLLSLVGWALGLFITGMILRYGKRIQVLAWSTVWILQPFSCVFYPLSALPEWAQTIARFVPTTYVFENLRSLLSSGVVNYTQLLYSLITSLVLLFFMILFLRASFERARESGMLAKAD